MKPAGTSATLLAYFSRAGENYWYGRRRDLAVGNTKAAADTIADLAGVEVFRIEEDEPYPHDFDTTLARNQREQARDARPLITGSLPDPDRFDTVLLGCPVWNNRAPMIMHTFLDGFDMAGKTMYPFATYGIGVGQVFDDYADLYVGRAVIGEGLALRGEEVAEAEPDIEHWLTGIGLLQS
ncbi:flavodoxin [Streptomonospora wellingtoniae]|uniref:Flavodoxin n=1 Tax=Streptomonospora wellingtoniae TaxID=3075544 RepID=A0ABU2KNS3_9ACTN|nr:flavodoxin [Streptomonospora sp. DSM 45055]MDT0300925.1 flavodoxin [Streptomonospora sp. DSM 45055]